ncbi:hypothetical protein H924_04935 [Corynebacterium callunae DSM 20147]|uniref:Uncharacterized protein n=1 Tax=Corynebacterium callunae DSM 20147 TaxID=1121353 RepID=M1UYB6_9CORY|nr:hypothetical protein H924_04935 [Corynebacterium callunae DSM 20147]
MKIGIIGATGTSGQAFMQKHISAATKLWR